MTYRLYHRPGWGSAIIEAALIVAGLDFVTSATGDPKKKMPLIRKVNPLGQYPTLILPDGTYMSESAAILLHLGDVVPEAGLVPPPGDPTRDHFLRLLITIVGAIYPTFTYADYPEQYVSSAKAQKELVDNSRERRKRIWRQIEAAITPNPWVLGERFSGLDLYVAVMTHWGPGRQWFEEECPKLMSVAHAADAIPVLAPMWKRNFGS